MFRHRIVVFNLLCRLLGLALCTVLPDGFLAAKGAESLPLSSNASDSEQVFFPFDDYAIPFNNGLLLTLAHGKKSLDKPVLSVGKTGEPDSVKIEYYGTVIHVGEEFRMWYIGLDDSHESICYAVSTNGMVWEKPKLGLVEYNGNKQNNLVSLDGTNLMEGATSLVLYEPEDPNPDRRYKMLREASPTELPAAYSSDGLRWKSIPGGGVIKTGVLEPCGLMKFNGCYYVNGQGGTIPHPLKGAGKRMAVTFVSYDFEHWTTAAHLCFRRDPLPPVRQPILNFIAANRCTWARASGTAAMSCWAFTANTTM